MKDNYVNQPTYQAGLIQSKAYRALSNFLTEALDEFGVNMSEWKLLGQLYGAPSLKPSEISSRLYIRPPITSRLLKGLEKKRLVLKLTNKKDSRQVYIKITSNGRKLIDKSEAKIHRQLRAFLGDIDRRDLAVYLKVISQIAHKL